MRATNDRIQLETRYCTSTFIAIFLFVIPLTTAWGPHEGSKAETPATKKMLVDYRNKHLYTYRPSQIVHMYPNSRPPLPFIPSIRTIYQPRTRPIPVSCTSESPNAPAGNSSCRCQPTSVDHRPFVFRSSDAACKRVSHQELNKNKNIHWRDHFLSARNPLHRVYVSRK